AMERGWIFSNYPLWRKFMGATRIVDNRTDLAELTALANNSALTLDVTEIDLRRLPEHIKAALYTAAKSFSAPQLRESGHIDARSATSFSAPQLRKSGDIDASNAVSFSAPLLQESGDIFAPSAASFSAPLLQKSGEMYAHS